MPFNPNDIGHVAEHNRISTVLDGKADTTALDSAVAGYVGASSATQTAADARYVRGTGLLDATVAALVPGPSSTKTALDAAYVAPVAYAPAPTGVYATDTANILAAVNKLPVGGSNPGGIVILRLGQYNASLPNIAYITYRGSGRAGTEIRCSSGSLLAPTANLTQMSFEYLALSTTAAHLFEFGSTGGLNMTKFSHCTLVTYANAASLFHQSGTGDFIEVSFDDCDFNRQSTATVSAIDMRNSAGALNSNVWANCRFQSNMCTSTPFVRIEGTLGAYAHDNAFRNIVGERNVGGLIHAYSVSGLTISDVGEWDAGATNYADHIINIQTSATAGGVVSRGVSIANAGTRFGTMATGKNHVNIGATSNAAFLERIGDPNGTSKISYFLGQSMRDAWTTSIAFPTTTYIVNKDLDGTVIANGTSITVTLPAPSALPYAGRKFTVKNLNATALTVNATGGAVIDGAASKSLAQYAVITVTTDGAGWFIV